MANLSVNVYTPPIPPQQKALVQPELTRFQRTPHPTDPTDTTDEERILLQSLSFPRVDESDSSDCSDSDETVPLDLSLAPSTPSHEMDTGDMDPFRKALFTEKVSFSIPSGLPQLVRATLNTTETRLMSITSLIHLLGNLSSQEEPKESGVNFEAEQEDEVIDSLLEEERQAEEDEYLEEAALGAPLTRYQTRRVDTDGAIEEGTDLVAATSAAAPMDL